MSLFTSKFFSGLESQRSPFAAIDTRYSSRFMGGKPATLIDGSNCEISNRLTLIRRPGVVPFGPSIPPPLAFYPWQRSTPPSLLTVVDTASALYRYSSTYAGIYFNKAAAAGQTNVYNVINTLYCGDGVDLFKIVGPNLLTQSNTFTNNSYWVKGNSGITPGQADPVGGTAASYWSSVGSNPYLLQTLSLRYTPIPGNTFTFSIWLRCDTLNQQVTLEIQDQVPSVVVSKTVTLTSTWTKYEVTGTCSNGAATSGGPTITVSLSATFLAFLPPYVYGAQLEVGGPSTPTELTTVKPQGMWLWGTAAPTIAPALNFGAQSPYWLPSTVFNQGYIIDGNGYIQGVVTGGTSDLTQPAFAVSLAYLTTDSGVTWRNCGQLGALQKWQGNTVYDSLYPPGPAVLDSNNNIQMLVSYSGSGTSGALAPIWATNVGSQTVDNTGPNQITWVNLGLFLSGPKVGWQYYYAWINSYTGNPSAASPVSVNTGPLYTSGVTVSGPGSSDPQNDQVGIYRNVDGGPFFYQLAVINVPQGQSWSYLDTTPDSQLNTSIYAPIGLLNSPPPPGLTALEYHAGRL